MTELDVLPPLYKKERATMYRTETDKTTRKVRNMSWTAAATACILYFLKIRFFAVSPLPEAIEAALGIVISGVISGAAAWIVGFMTRPAKEDGVIPDGATAESMSDATISEPAD